MEGLFKFWDVAACRQPRATPLYRDRLEISKKYNPRNHSRIPSGGKVNDPLTFHDARNPGLGGFEDGITDWAICRFCMSRSPAWAAAGYHGYVEEPMIPPLE
jgi:hypothetical protein